MSNPNSESKIEDRDIENEDLKAKKTSQKMTAISAKNQVM